MSSAEHLVVSKASFAQILWDYQTLLEADETPCESLAFTSDVFPSRSADVDLQLHDSPPLTADVNKQHIWANLR